MMEKQTIYINDKEYEIFLFHVPMFHEDWHKADELGLEYVSYRRYDCSDVDDHRMLFCKHDDKRVIKKYYECWNTF